VTNEAGCVGLIFRQKFGILELLDGDRPNDYPNNVRP
jgi:hypothetical protein